RLDVVRAVTGEHLVFRIVQRRQVETWERNLLHELCLIIRIGFVTVIIACQLALAPRAQGLQRRRLRIYASEGISPAMPETVERLARLHVDGAREIGVPETFERVSRVISVFVRLEGKQARTRCGLLARMYKLQEADFDQFGVDRNFASASCCFQRLCRTRRTVV